MTKTRDPVKTAALPANSPAHGSHAVRETDKPTSRKKDDFSWSLDNMLRWYAEDIKEEHVEEEQQQKADVQEFVQLLEQIFSPKPLSAAEMLEMGELSQADILRINPHDQEAMAMRMAEIVDHEQGRRYFLVGKALESYESRQMTQSLLSQQGLGTPNPSTNRAAAAAAPAGAAGAPASSRPTEFRVTTPKEVQGELIASINKASKLTGVPTALLGAMAGIESGFGKNLQSPTGAIGTMQQTGGYRDTMWKVYGETIAQHVPQAAAALTGGLTKEEKRALAFNNDAAVLMTALRARDFAKQYKLDINDPKTWGLVYMDHNSGEGSVKKILAGEMTDKFIRDVNPAVYRNVNTPQEALASFQSKMIGYAKAYEKVEAAYDPAVIALRTPRPGLVAVAGKDGLKPEPVPG